MAHEDSTAGTAKRPVCVYDGSCGICTKMAKWASRRSPIEFTDSADLTHRGVDESEYPNYLVFAGRTVERRHRAVGSVLLTMPWPYNWLGRIVNFKPLGPIARAAYSYIARNRRIIPGWLFPV